MGGFEGESRLRGTAASFWWERCWFYRWKGSSSGIDGGDGGGGAVVDLGSCIKFWRDPHGNIFDCDSDDGGGAHGCDCCGFEERIHFAELERICCGSRYLIQSRPYLRDIKFRE